MKFSPVRIDEKPVMKIPDGRRHDVGVAVGAAVRRVKRPAGIDAAGQQGIEREQPAQHVDVPAQQIQPGKGQIAGAHHERHEEIAQHGRESTESERKTP